MNRDLILLSISLFTWGIGEGMFMLFQPLYLEQMGANTMVIGAIMSLVGIAMTVGHLPAGYLADRFGRRPLMIVSWMLATLATGLMALANSLPVFVAGSVLYGLTAFVSGPMNSYITAARGKLSVGRSLTLISAVYNTGAILGPLAGGLLGKAINLRVSFSIAFGIFILSTCIVFFIRPQPIEKRPESTSTLKNLQNIFTPRYVQYLIIIFFVMLFMYLPQPLSQNFLQNERGVRLDYIGLLISARSLGVVILID